MAGSKQQGHVTDLFVPQKGAGWIPILGQDFEALNSKQHYTGHEMTQNREIVCHLLMALYQNSLIWNNANQTVPTL
jgi:hypothetical protein